MQLKADTRLILLFDYLSVSASCLMSIKCWWRRSTTANKLGTVLEKDRVADLTANEVPDLIHELLGQSERMLTVPVVKFVSRRKKIRELRKRERVFSLHLHTLRLELLLQWFCYNTSFLQSSASILQKKKQKRIMSRRRSSWNGRVFFGIA